MNQRQGTIAEVKERGMVYVTECDIMKTQKREKIHLLEVIELGPVRNSEVVKPESGGVMGT